LAHSSPPEIGPVLESHRAQLQLHCYRMTGSLHDSEDLVQETLLRAWRSYDSFQEKSSLRTWLYRIATNVCLDLLRSRQRRRMRPDGRYHPEAKFSILGNASQGHRGQL